MTLGVLEGLRVGVVVGVFVVGGLDGGRVGETVGG
jgi:hypothetical protein